MREVWEDGGRERTPADWKREVVFPWVAGKLSPLDAGYDWASGWKNETIDIDT